MSLDTSAQQLLDAMSPQQIRSVLRSFGLGETNTNTRAHGRRRTEQRNQRAPTRAKRTLNSYMVFRSYYQVLFSGQQKTSSRHLADLWKFEKIYVAKWIILARVFTAIRNEEDSLRNKKVDLQDFLDLAAPLVGVLDPSAYSEHIRANGLFTRAGDVVPATKERLRALPMLPTPQISDYDLLVYLHTQGFYTGRPHRDIFSRRWESASLQTQDAAPIRMERVAPPSAEILPEETIDSPQTEVMTQLPQSDHVEDNNYEDFDDSALWSQMVTFDPIYEPFIFNPFVGDPFDASCISIETQPWLTSF